MLRYALLITAVLAACSKKDPVCGDGTERRGGKCVSPSPALVPGEAVSRQSESEAAAILAEFRLRQEQYRLENGAYLSTGEEADLFPRLVGDLGPLETLPAAWRALRIEFSDRATARCGYSSPAGRPDQAAKIGHVGKAFNFKPPAKGDWFYVVARCPKAETFYFSSVHGHGVGSKSFSEIE